MSLLVPSSHTIRHPAAALSQPPQWSAAAASLHNPVVLEQMLEQARQQLALRLQPLPEPWPGCVLVFSVAHAEHQTTVFHLKAHTFQSAWREGSIRVRQWAWARKVDRVVLRIDWAEDVSVYPIGHRISASALQQLRRSNSALADLDLEQTILLQHALLEPRTDLPEWAEPLIAHEAAPTPFLLLQMRGIFLEPHSDILTLLPRNMLMPRPASLANLEKQWRTTRQATTTQLIAQQMPNGSWPHSSSLSEHLQLQYALLMRMCDEQGATPSHTTAAIRTSLTHAFDYATNTSCEQAHEHALALLVLSRCVHLLEHNGSSMALRCAYLHSLALQTEQALDTAAQPSSMQPQDLPHFHALQTLQQLALLAYASCCDHLSIQSPSAARSIRPMADYSADWLCLLGLYLTDAHSPHPAWLSIALLDACQHIHQPRFTSQHRQLLHKQVLQSFNALHQGFTWPETAIYLTQGPHTSRLWETQPDVPTTAQQVSGINHASACIALLRHLEIVPPAHSTSLDLGDTPAQQNPTPMRWSGQSLALLTAGQWRLPHGSSEPLTISSLTVSRHHHSQDAAVLVRHTGDTLGVPAALAPSLQASALVQVAGNPIQADVPVLEIADLNLALLRLAHHARQRIQAKVIGITGCVGKTSTLRMLTQCLFGHCTPHQESIVQHAPELQMIHWSDSTPWVLAEIPLDTAPEHLRLLEPDLLVVTNLPSIFASSEHSLLHHHKQQNLQRLMAHMQPGSLMVLNNAELPMDLVQDLATHSGIELYCFGTPPPSACTHGPAETQSAASALSESTATDEILHLQHVVNGAHMSLNAQAALAVLHALELPVGSHIEVLRQWHPLPGAGQSEHLAGNQILLDHSNTQELQAVQAAFSQLLSHTPDASRRCIVFGGIKTGSQPMNNLSKAQLQVEPLLRSTGAKHILLYGQAMLHLAHKLRDLPHVAWFKDLNQLIDTLLRSLQAHDTVLLAGRAIVNLGIVADAIRDNTDEFA